VTEIPLENEIKIRRGLVSPYKQGSRREFQAPRTIRMEKKRLRVLGKDQGLRVNEASYELAKPKNSKPGDGGDPGEIKRAKSRWNEENCEGSGGKRKKREREKRIRGA